MWRLCPQGFALRRLPAQWVLAYGARLGRVLLAEQQCALWIRFITDDVLEVYHYDGNHQNNAFDNLRLLHGHCHNIVHGQRC